jgi:hypothetical protein
MAYKFQRGAAILSGSAKFEDGLVETDVDDNTAANIVAEIDAGEIPIAKLAEKTISGKDLGTNLDALSLASDSGLAMSAGNYNGTAAVSFGLDMNSLAAGAVNVGADSIGIIDADDSNNSKKESIADLMTAVAGDGLAAASGVLAVQVSGALKVASDKVGLTGSFAGPGLGFEGGADSISKLNLRFDSLGVETTDKADLEANDLFSYFDTADNTQRKVKVPVLRNNVYSQVSGDATIADGGALTIAAGAIEHGMLAEDIISGQDELAHADIVDADELMISDAGTIKRVGVDSLRDHYFGVVSGDATIADGGALTIAADSVEGTMLNTNAADGSTMELSSDSLSVLKVPNALTAGDGIDAAGTFDGAAARTLSVSAAQTTITSVKNDSLVVGRASGNDHIDFSAAGTVAIDTNNIARLSITDATSTFSNDLVVGGNLTVNGTTTTVNSSTIEITSSFTFEGATPDGFETVFGVIDPTADRQISLPDNEGVLAIFSPTLSDSELATQLTAAPSELNLLDAGAGSSVGLASGDGVIIFDASDSNVAKKVLVSDIVSLGQTLGVASKADGNNLEADKVNFFGDLNADATVTLPASAGLVAGQSVYIKAKNLTSGAKIIINTQASDQKIDAEDSIVLESPFASVRLIYVAADDFRVF